MKGKGYEMNEINVSVDIILKQLVGLRKDLSEMDRSIRAFQKTIYTNREAMELLDVGAKTLKKWRDTGEIGFSCKGNMYYYTKKDITDFLERNHYEAFAQMM